MQSFYWFAFKAHQYHNRIDFMIESKILRSYQFGKHLTALNNLHSHLKFYDYRLYVRSKKERNYIECILNE